MTAAPPGGTSSTVGEPRITYSLAGDGPTVRDMSDEGALFMLRREIWDLPVVARFRIDGEPVSKARARFTKKGSKTEAYTPEKTHNAEQAVGWKFRQAAPRHRLDPEKTYGVMALFFCGTRQRRDVDNMLKLILDGLNHVAWPDDNQVTEVSAKKTLTLPENARTEVVVYEVGLVQRFTKECGQCGKDFPVFLARGRSGGRYQKKFCSQDCANAARQKVDRTPKACGNCGREFIPTSHQPTYCSAECGRAQGRQTVTCSRCGKQFTKQKCHVRAVNYCSTECRQTAERGKTTSSPRGTCETCGGPTSKKTYRQCNACRMKVTGNPKIVITDLGGAR